MYYWFIIYSYYIYSKIIKKYQVIINISDTLQHESSLIFKGSECGGEA